MGNLGMSTYPQAHAVRVHHGPRVVSNRKELGGILGVIHSEKSYLSIGILFLMAFWIQYLFELEWEWLVHMQDHETFQQCTGLALASYVAHQWYLSSLRTRGGIKSGKLQFLRHKRAGIWASLLFYLHSTQLGFAYLFFLSLVYFANVVVGFCNPETLMIKTKWFYTSWILIHVSLSVLLVILIGFHVCIAFIYE